MIEQWRKIQNTEEQDEAADGRNANRRNGDVRENEKANEPDDEVFVTLRGGLNHFLNWSDRTSPWRKAGWASSRWQGCAEVVSGTAKVLLKSTFQQPFLFMVECMSSSRPCHSQLSLPWLHQVADLIFFWANTMYCSWNISPECFSLSWP